MKKERLLYHICYYSHVCFHLAFWIYFGILIIIHFLGFEIDSCYGYLFFLLLGLWIGSAATLAATRFMKKVHQKELDKDKNNR